MEPMLLFPVKSMALLTLFWLGYQALRNETFFTANRWYLLAGLITSVVLPLVTITKTVWVDPAPQYVWTAETIPAQVAEEPFDWSALIFGVYGIGFIAFLILFLRNFIALQRVIRNPGQKDSGFRYIDTPDNVAPFSYLNCIVYNSNHYSQEELSGILEHERTHCREKHSVDVLLLHLYCTVFWFNPIAWLYKKAAMQNLEFIADRQATRACDKKGYQFTMLRVASDWQPLPISNPFYQSLIKKRIVMLNKSQSKRRNSWKYFLVVPLLAAFLLYFQVRVVAQERRVITESEVFEHKTEVVVDKNTSDAQLKADAERLKKERGVKLKFSKVKRNAQGEITGIKAEYKGPDGKKGTTQFSGQDPISPLSFYIHSDGKMGFGQPRSFPRVVKINGQGIGHGEGHEEFKFDFNGEDIIGMEIPEIDIEIPEVPMPGMPEWTSDKVKSKVFIRKDGEKPVVIVNGERIDVDTDIDLDMDVDGKTFTYSFSSDGEGEDVMIVNGKKIQAEAMEKAKAAMEKAGVKRAEVHKKVEEAMGKRREAIEKRKEAAIARGHFFSDEMSKTDREQMKAELDAARAELEKARAELEKERKALEKARSEKK